MMWKALSPPQTPHNNCDPAIMHHHFPMGLRERGSFMKVVRLGLCAAALTTVAAALLTGRSWTARVVAQTGAPDKKKLAEDATRILKTYCFACHGKDLDDLSGDMNILDQLHLAERERVVPGSPDKSKLIQRIENDRKPMPPKSAKNPVPAEQVKIRREWIAPGGKLQPPTRTTTPAAPEKLKLAAEVAAIFTSHCYECHGKDPRNVARKFKVFDAEHRSQRKRVVPGKPEESLLIARV